MITIDKYGQSVKIYDGEVNMFFDREPLLRGCYIIKATGIVYILNYIFGHYTDFVINGVQITTIEEFTEQYALVIPLECGGSGGGERFGIEDITTPSDRGVDMNGKDLNIFNARSFTAGTTTGLGIYADNETSQIGATKSGFQSNDADTEFENKATAQRWL
jgi:hypothetical protein